MVHRRDLIGHFEWLAGSRYYEEVLDEALVSIALAARGLEGEWVEYGAAWTTASYVVGVFGLASFVERSRADLGPFAGRSRCRRCGGSAD
jgi:hypothetical protein